MGIENIRKLHQEQRFGDALVEVETQLHSYQENAHLWVLRGNLMQLSEMPPGFTLDEVEKSYLTALELEPDSVEAMEELAHFYYAVIDDRPKAQKLLERLDARLTQLRKGCEKIRLWLDKSDTRE